MKIEIKMPFFRRSNDRGKDKDDASPSPSVLCQWNAAPGDLVEAGEILFEAETAKVVSQVEASARIRILSLLAEEGDEVLPGAVVAVAETVDDQPSDDRPCDDRPSAGPSPEPEA